MTRPLDVVTVGEALVDLVDPEAADLTSAHRFISVPGGAPANTACAVARLGGSSALVGAVGSDPFGTVLRDTLQSFGVDLAGLLMLDRRTSLALAATGGDVPEFVFYRDADAALSLADIPEELIAAASFVHVSSMALLSEPSRSATLHALDLARRHGAGISLDPNIRLSSWPSAGAARVALEPLTASADVLKVNADEAVILTGQEDTEKAIESLGREDALVIITAGSEGCLWRRGRDGGRVPGFPVEVVETTGAGDAFAGALLFQLARQECALKEIPAPTLEDSLRFACAAAAITCTAPGAMTALPTYEQVMAVVPGQPPWSGLT